MSVPSRQADLAWMLAHSPAGVTVTLGAASTQGSLRLAGEEQLEAEGIALGTRVATILIATGSLPALAAGAQLTAAGATWRVHRHYPESDGAVTRLVCVPA